MALGSVERPGNALTKPTNISLGIERLSVFNMPPVDFVRLTAELTCNSVGLMLAPSHAYNPHGYPDWSLRDNAAMRRDLVTTTRDEGVSIALVEGFATVAGQDPDAWIRDLDLVCELGCGRVAIASLDKDPQGTVDGIARFCQMAADRSLLVCAEVGSMRAASRIDKALTLVRDVAMANFSLLIDTMHYFRLGGTLTEFAAINPALIGYVQLSDAPLSQRFDTYLEEALYERMVPGEGELPLREFLRLLSPDVVVSLELPIRSLAEQGYGPRQRLAPCVTAAKTLLEGTHRKRSQ